ncbi:MAG: exported protein of unknown function [Candidatus Saccharibacteria bacterium]|nr:exported protein of unknown function [Candidatus Saccharibacteria bacterium]
MAWKQTAKYVIALMLPVLLLPAVALAAQSSSSNYQVNEVFFGSGGELNACSTSYCSKQSAGDLAVGSTASNSYRAQAGFNTDRSPYIEFTVNNTNINLGTLTATSTRTATASFTVKAYLAHGYNVTNASDPPSNNGYTMQALTIPTASSVGTEQFGMNLVANTIPSTFGADPTYTPDNSFSFGQVAPDYSSTNLFKYLKDDTVAFSSASTSDTTYTVSYLFNISHVTPGGNYTLRHVLVATGTY